MSPNEKFKFFLFGVQNTFGNGDFLTNFLRGCLDLRKNTYLNIQFKPNLHLRSWQTTNAIVVHVRFVQDDDKVSCLNA
jgi:hypothetical protein